MVDVESYKLDFWNTNYKLVLSEFSMEFLFVIILDLFQHRA